MVAAKQGHSVARLILGTYTYMDRVFRKTERKQQDGYGWRRNRG